MATGTKDIMTTTVTTAQHRQQLEKKAKTIERMMSLIFYEKASLDYFSVVAWSGQSINCLANDPEGNSEQNSVNDP